MSVELLEDRVLLSVSPWPTAPLSEPAATDTVAAALEQEIRFDPIPEMAELAAGPLEQAVAAAPSLNGEPFELHSNPTATKVIYLDFDGHVTSGTTWNDTYGDDFTTPPFSFEGDETFSNNELARIQAIWERVAEDYIPFNVDVTTEDPGEDALKKVGSGDSRWGIRVCIGGNWNDWYGSSAGGVAYIGSFTDDTDEPCFAFSKNLVNGREDYTAETVSHEVGHTLGLHHDGTSSDEYYTGHGSGPTGWAPIMGDAKYKQLTQWSKGEYPDANRPEDDLREITTNNGFGYRADDRGDERDTATPLTINDAVNVSGDGIIERNTDVDFFSFTTAAGAIQLDVEPFCRSPNLDIRADLYDASDNLVASSDPEHQLDAHLAVDVPAGTYYLSIDGVGNGDLSTGYSDYGSLGYYSISGTVPGIAARRVFYNNSVHDGDGAIATDKKALLPGEVATFANYTSYTLGINGIMVDVVGLFEGVVPGSADFEFHVGNDDTPADWTKLDVESTVTLQPGAGVGGCDRVTIVLPDGAAANTWLQVTANLGFPDDDVFYFGNAVGESGNSIDDAKVTVTDLLLARNNGRDFQNRAAVDFPYDYNRDAHVDAVDVLVARNNQTSFLTQLKLIDLSVAEQSEPLTSLGELAWLQEQEPFGAEEQSSSGDRPTLQVTDLLLFARP